MVLHAIVVRLDPVQSCLKVAGNLHLKAKMSASEQAAAFFAEKRNFPVTVTLRYVLLRVG